MDLMQLRRNLLMQMIPQEQELYPIGTDVYGGVVFLKSATLSTTTGEVVTGDYGVSDFIEVSTNYQYTRSYRLYGVFNYDENYNYLGYQGGVNNLQTSVISSFLPGTKYIRTLVHSNYVASATGLIYQGSCWLKRTA